MSYEQIKEKNYSLSAGQYFEVRIDYKEITEKEFKLKMNSYKQNLSILFSNSNALEVEIKSNLESILK